MPKALPLSAAGNTEVTKAIPVANIMALPIPCNARREISTIADGANDEISDEIENMNMP